MVEIHGTGTFLLRGRIAAEAGPGFGLKQANDLLKSGGMPPVSGEVSAEAGRRGTIAHGIIAAHDSGGHGSGLSIRFDALASHDITYVGIIQNARAGGLGEFRLPYVLTNCHNSLCAVGGTINEDDHLFGLSAARKYGGIYVPAHQAVIHQYVREAIAGCGRMILGSDSHTRYGALGAMGVGEGGPELVKQLLGGTYAAPYPEVVAVRLDGEPRPGVGPQDIALALIKAVFEKGLVRNKVLEFVGPGIQRLSVDFRNGIDVMTTETACLSSIWLTDDAVKDYFAAHGRPADYRRLLPADIAYYDGMIRIDMGEVEPMIALPFHPSNAYTIKELNANTMEILSIVEKRASLQREDSKVPVKLRDKTRDGRLSFGQGVIAGCAGGTFENVWTAAEMLSKGSVGTGAFSLNVYPASQPVAMELIRQGAVEALMSAGAVVKTAFCGPCFGAGDVPANDTISARHTTRNFANREGSKPDSGQTAYVALMDARSIAATALAGGRLTAATELPSLPGSPPSYRFDGRAYESRVYNGFGKPHVDEPLRLGPNITDWPEMLPLPENLILKIVSVIGDPVTTTDELIPSGETSSYRSNPVKLAEFTLSRKDPGYVGRAKEVMAAEAVRRSGGAPVLAGVTGVELKTTAIASAVAARKPGDGSAREQAASCQRVLGGLANIAVGYATKRYRSNLVNWGLLPFIVDEKTFDDLAVGDAILLNGLRAAIAGGAERIEGNVYREGKSRPIPLTLPELGPEERGILLSGCLINSMKK
jgi:aconitate hydratase